MSVDMDGMKRFQAAIKAEMVDAYKQIGVRILTQWRREFDANSRGGGFWKPLLLSTALGRRKQARKNALAKVVNEGGTPEEAERAAEIENKTRARLKSGKVVYTKRANAILVATGTLKRSLAPGRPGNVIESITESGTVGIRVGIGGSAMSQRKSGKGQKPGRITIGQLARIHNDGNKNLPARRIVNPLTADTRRAMRNYQLAAVNRAANK